MQKNIGIEYLSGAGPYAWTVIFRGGWAGNFSMWIVYYSTIHTVFHTYTCIQYIHTCTYTVIAQYILYFQPHGIVAYNLSSLTEIQGL